MECNQDLEQATQEQSQPILVNRRYYQDQLNSFLERWDDLTQRRDYEEHELYSARKELNSIFKSALVNSNLLHYPAEPSQDQAEVKAQDPEIEPTGSQPEEPAMQATDHRTTSEPPLEEGYEYECDTDSQGQCTIPRKVKIKGPEAHEAKARI